MNCTCCRREVRRALEQNSNASRVPFFFPLEHEEHAKRDFGAVQSARASQPPASLRTVANLVYSGSTLSFMMIVCYSAGAGIGQLEELVARRHDRVINTARQHVNLGLREASPYRSQAAGYLGGLHGAVTSIHRDIQIAWPRLHIHTSTAGSGQPSPRPSCKRLHLTSAAARSPPAA